MNRMNHIGSPLNQGILDESSFAIATAFRGASEEDTRLILNAMSQPSHVADLRFYMVPCSWMDACLPFLSGKVDRRPIKKIENAPFLEGGTVSDDDDEDFLYGPPTSSSSSAQKSGGLRKDLRHKIDFFLVGNNVWTLISGKFGYDNELHFSASSSGTTLTVYIDQFLKVDVPPTGRFSYETTNPTDVVPEEDDDDDDNLDAFKVAFPKKTDEQEEKTENRIILLPSSESSSSSFSNGKKDSSRFSTSAKSAPSPIETAAMRKRKRFGSGLGNLGNTCFMNSTLQCLAHTEPLRRYFVSGDYERDLNRDNPLGTGGELATQFAELLSEMFGMTSFRTNTYTSVVYPRSFKITLGKHAEQFMGYDQHDSQELATYLLDALHEDTNRVTKKPYIEKPEQGQDEPDDEAANKAWGLHLQREDSKVLEHFMGQVKSRVQCPRAGCGRVSTTFDPFMYLSVPIPGASERNLEVTFVPRDGPMRKMTITIPKTAMFETVLEKVSELFKEKTGRLIDPSDLHGCDVWNHEVYAVLNGQPVEKIRETDKTYIYELRTKAEIEAMRESDVEEEEIDEDVLVPTNSARRSLIMEIDTSSRLYTQGIDEHRNQWDDDLFPDFLVGSRLKATRILNKNRSTLQEKIKFYARLEDFLDCLYETKEVVGMEEDPEDHQDAETEDEEADENDPPKAIDDDEDEDTTPTISDIVHQFKDTFTLRTVEEVKLLELIAYNYREFILDIHRESQRSLEQYKDGFIAQVVFKIKMHGITDKQFGPMCLRIPGKMTVFQLRQELAKVLPFKGMPRDEMEDSKAACTEDSEVNMSLDSISSENEKGGAESVNHEVENGTKRSPEMVMRMVPMTYSQKSFSGTYHYSRPSFNTHQLGMLGARDDIFTAEPDRSVSVAIATDPAEKALVADLVGAQGKIFLNWPDDLTDSYLDLHALDESVEFETKAEPQQAKTTTVSDCIEKYCQMEQLEETDKWYCNRCKEHVRAWKQFHLYRTPPILIVHLKRFQFSATTHRRDKIDKFIDFPLEGLDLSSEVMHWKEDEKPIYDCYAVSNHYGGLGGGHYTAYAMSDDGVWCHYDDSRVTTDVDKKEVITNAAYVLYYKRKDVVFQTPDFEIPVPAVVQDFKDGSSSPTAAVEDENSNPNEGPMGTSMMEIGEPGVIVESSHSSTSPMADDASGDSLSMGAYQSSSEPRHQGFLKDVPRQ